MLNNYFTLLHLTGDVAGAFKGSRLASVFSQEKNQCVISSGRSEHLVISCEPSANFLYLSPSFSRARRNTVDIFESVRGKDIESVTLQPADREIVIGLHGGGQILIQLFGSRANIFFVDEERVVVDAFLKPKEHIGQKVPSPHEPWSFPSGETFARHLHTIGHLRVSAALKKTFRLFGGVVITEILFRAGLEDKAIVQLQTEATERLHDVSKAVYEELLGPPSPRISFDDKGPVALAILDLRHLGHLRSERFDSLHEAIRLFVRTSRRTEGFANEKDRVMGRIDHELQKLERTLAKMANEAASAERATLAETFGKLLTANLPALSKGMTSVLLENVFSPRRENMEIPLDPRLTPSQNAAKYFEKAKKGKHALLGQGERKVELNERYDRLQQLRSSLEPLQAPDQWTDVLRTHEPVLELLGMKREGRKAPQEPSPLFRMFHVEGGFEVWAGKNSENNDLLTLRHARPNDWWFHARGSGGSHVVLRAGTGKGEISKKAIRQAAGIAAYYSKMKNSKLVPVAMTLRKYVRKPRGAPPGTVRIEREEVLMVEPKLPVMKVKE